MTYEPADPSAPPEPLEDIPWTQQPLSTGHMLLAERDLGRNRKLKRRQFPFGFGLAEGAANRLTRNAASRSRHFGSVARRAHGT